MRRLFRLLIVGGLITAAWAFVRQLLEGSERAPLQRVGDVAGDLTESVEGVAKSAAGSAKAAGETVRDQVSSAASVTTGGNGTAGLSKAELYKEAQKLDVEGRSKMSKDELADAVARARRGGGS